MATKSLNKAQLIGNLTADPELRYTPQGTPVINFSVATNRSWKDSQGQAKEEATFHRVVAWSKLAEICAQLLSKGSKVYIAGRISNRDWEDSEGQRHFVTEIVADDMLILDSRYREPRETRDVVSEEVDEEPAPPEPIKAKPAKKS